MIWRSFYCIVLGVVHLHSGISLSAQEKAVSDSTLTKPRPEFSAFIEACYHYDFGYPRSNARPAFLYQYNQHNRLDINLGVVRADYANDRVRGAMALMVGTYAQANMALEPDLYRNVHEARVGFKLTNNNKLWLDAGIFGSHIGLENAVGTDNWTLTRSVNAENSPYFLSGAKLTFAASQKVEFTALYLNGWQRITKIQQNIPCFGTQLQWKIKDGMKFNWSTFTGSDVPDSLALYRVFNNVWWSWEGKKWGIQVSADLGMQEIPLVKDTAGSWTTWGDCAVIVRRKLGVRSHIVGRAEFYTDPEQVIVKTNTENGLTTLGYSLGLDFQVMPDAFLRIEGRIFQGGDSHFEPTFGTVQDNTAITVSMAAQF